MYSIEKLTVIGSKFFKHRKSQLSPGQAGTVEVESAEVENHLHFRNDQYLNRPRAGMDERFRDVAQTASPSDGIQDEKVTLQSKPALILSIIFTKMIR